MTSLTHDLRRVIRARRDEHARHELGHQSRITDLELLIALGKLTDNQREAWIDVNVLGHTGQAIANRMNLSRSYVSKLECEATRKLTDILGHTDFTDRWADAA